MDESEIAVQNNDSCESNKLSPRFNVVQVPGSGEEVVAEDEYPDNEFAQRCPSTAENTIGYSTHEAVPMTVFYRNDSSHNQGKNTRKARPTLDQLRKGFEKDGNDSETQVSVKVFNNNTCTFVYIIGVQSICLSSLPPAGYCL